MKLVKRKMAMIKPYWRNPRNNEEAVHTTKKSIETYGYNVPITIDQNDVIITGHTRYKALMQLGHEEIDVVQLDLNDKKAKEYRIVDNKSSEIAEWNMKDLIPELREIEDIDTMNMFFKDLDVEAIVKNSVGEIDFKDITQDSVDKLNEKMQTQHHKSKEEMLYSEVEVICPHCLKDFYINKEQIQSSL